MDGLGPCFGEWHTLNETRETATLCIVEVNVANLLVRELPLDLCGHDLAFAYFCADDHVRLVVRAQGHEARANVVWHFAGLQRSLLRVATYVDRARCLVGRVGRLVLVGQQQQLLADLGVRQADAAGIAWSVLGDDADCAELSKLFVREIEERLKRLFWQADQLKRMPGG